LGPRRNEVAGEWRRLHIEELYDVDPSLDFIPVFKSRRTKWTGYVACMGGGEEVHTGVWWENLRQREHMEYLGVEGREY
jgi:hypothetical protein